MWLQNTFTSEIPKKDRKNFRRGYYYFFFQSFEWLSNIRSPVCFLHVSKGESTLASLRWVRVGQPCRILSPHPTPNPLPRPPCSPADCAQDSTAAPGTFSPLNAGSLLPASGLGEAPGGTFPGAVRAATQMNWVSLGFHPPAPRSRPSGGLQRTVPEAAAEAPWAAVSTPRKSWVFVPQYCPPKRDLMCPWKDSVPRSGNLGLSRSVSRLLNNQPYHLTARSEGIHLAVIKRKSWFLSVAIVREDLSRTGSRPPAPQWCKCCPIAPPTGGSWEAEGWAAVWRLRPRPPSPPDSPPNQPLSSPNGDCEVHAAHRGGENDSFKRRDGSESLWPKAKQIYSGESRWGKKMECSLCLCMYRYQIPLRFQKVRFN